MLHHKKTKVQKDHKIYDFSKKILLILKNEDKCVQGLFHLTRIANLNGIKLVDRL